MPDPQIENLTSSDFEVRRRKPKILFFDIETAPNLGYVWGKFEQNVIEYTNEWYMLAWSAKWQGGKHITKGLIDYDGYKPGSENDGDLVRELHTLIEEADIIVAHNGDRFDIKRSNTRFIENGLRPPPPQRTVDTLKIARRHFSFNSNKLDDLGRRLGVGRKAQTGGFDLWKGCMSGDAKAWRTMKRYNAQDVRLLEAVYNKMLPWIGNHPHIGILSDVENGCRNCGGTNLIRRGWHTTRTGKNPRVSCNDCGTWMLSKHKKVTDIR